MTVVGVVPDTRLRELSESSDPAFYLSDEQLPLAAGEIVIRTRGDEAAMVPSSRRAALDATATPAIAASIRWTR